MSSDEDAPDDMDAARIQDEAAATLPPSVANADTIIWGGEMRTVVAAGASLCGVDGDHLGLLDSDGTLLPPLHARLVRDWMAVGRITLDTRPRLPPGSQTGPRDGSDAE